MRWLITIVICACAVGMTVAAAFAINEFRNLEIAIQKQVEDAPRIAEEMRAKSIAELGGKIDAAFQREGAETRKTILASQRNLSSTFTTANEELQNTLNYQFDHARNEVTTVVREAISKADQQATAYRGELHLATSTLAEFKPMAKPLLHSAQMIEDTLPYYTDCGPDMCFPNHLYGAIGNFDKFTRSAAGAMRAIEKDTPKLSAAGTGIAVNLEKATKAYISPTWITFRAAVASTPLLGFFFK